MARAHPKNPRVCAGDASEVSHDLDWAFGRCGERNPFFAEDIPWEVEEAASTKSRSGRLRTSRSPAAAPTVWRPGRTELDAGVAREDGVVAAITFGRREMEIPRKAAAGRRPALPAGLRHAG